ncbi:unnamed protein product, partial [Allacma fusca]
MGVSVDVWGISVETSGVISGIRESRSGKIGLASGNRVTKSGMRGIVFGSVKCGAEGSLGVISEFSVVVTRTSW